MSVLHSWSLLVILYIAVCICSSQLPNLCLLPTCMLSHFSCVWLFSTLWTVASQAPLSMGSSRQESLNGLSFPSPGDLSNPGIEQRSPANCRQILYWLSYKGRFTDIRPLQYIYLPAVCHPWRSKMLYFLLSFLYKCIVLGWGCCRKPEF